MDDGDAFTDFQSGYWSSTTYAGDPDFAWFVSFGDGGVFAGDKTFSGFVLPVRGGS